MPLSLDQVLPQSNPDVQGSSLAGAWHQSPILCPTLPVAPLGCVTLGKSLTSLTCLLCKRWDGEGIIWKTL